MREIVTTGLRSLYIDVPALRPGTLGAYALALISVAMATALRLAVDQYVAGAQFVTFWPAVIVTTLIGGFGAGFLSAVLSTAAADFFVLSPRWAFNIGEDPTKLADLLLFGPLVFSSVIFLARMRSAAEREQAERVLREGQERLQLALDAAQLGWWRYDPRRRVVAADIRFREIFDVATDEIPVEKLKTLVHPADAERFWAEREAAVDPANPRRSHEYRVRRRDEEVRWVEVHWLPYFDGDHSDRRAVAVVGTVRDITERKQREEREHLLMREVNHRAKNMLSVVNAIAQQTAAKNPEVFIERFSERIQALSANQDLLIKSEWHGVEIVNLVRAQLAPFADLIGSRILVRGPKLLLNAASAQAIGLALHELTTNAGKYGALSKDMGRLDVGWGTEGETFRMSWTERDGPPVSPPQRRGFGTMVMKVMAERSLNGKVYLDYAPSGATWRLICPATNALEHRQGAEVVF